MSKEPEVQIKTSMKNMGGFVKILLAALSAMGFGAAGSVLTASSDASAMKEKIKALEESSQRYEVRISTTEADLNNIKGNMLDIKKDLAEIRGTSIQILFELQKDRNK